LREMPQATGVQRCENFVYSNIIFYFYENFVQMRNHNILPYSADARDLASRLRKKMTTCELIFWNATKKSQMHIVMRRQMPILDYVVDFYIKDIGLVIEIDGSSHNNNVLEDGKRQGRIEELGVTFVRFTNEQIIHTLPAVLEELESIIFDMRK